MHGIMMSALPWCYIWHIPMQGCATKWLSIVCDCLGNPESVYDVALEEVRQNLIGEIFDRDFQPIWRVSYCEDIFVTSNLGRHEETL